VIEKQLWNFLPSLEALIATYSQAGKSSPVNASILKRICEMHV
jgi:hypothetical protein